MRQSHAGTPVSVHRVRRADACPSCRDGGSRSHRALDTWSQCPTLTSLPGPARCATCSARDRPPSSSCTATSSTSCRTAASCSRSRPFSSRSMFASYDVVLRYDRSRGVRATRGGEDWGDWLQNSLGREAATQTLMREPGSALELIDRYLLRTLNLQALPGRRRRSPSGLPSSSSSPSSSCRAATRCSSADRSPPTPSRCSAGPTTRRSSSRTSSPCSSARACTTSTRSWSRTRTRRRCTCRCRTKPTCSRTSRRSSTTQFPDLAAKCDVPIETMAARLTGLSRVGARTAIALALGNDRRITAAWLGADQEGAHRARVPGAARLRRVAVHARQRRRAWNR